MPSAVANPEPALDTHADPHPDAPVPAPPGHIVTLAVTGASGSIFAIQMLRALDQDPRVARVHLVVSPSALRVFAEETASLGLTKPGPRSALVENLLGHAPRCTTLLPHDDIGASIASGSSPLDAMIVLPCSMGTLGGIAHGLAQNLIERAADVCLKERRRLILCVRETPFNLIHLRNMVAVTEAGASVFPVIPTFYNHPESVEDIARNYTHRVLQHIGLPQPNAYAWGS
jgi:4-hydroxy-3-polyprenylbenzoate decarboxylase